MRSRSLILCALLPLAAAASTLSAQSVAGGALTNELAAFGGSLAVTDGEVLVGEPANTLRPGTVYIYRRSASGWAEAAQLRAGDGSAADGFGSALAVDGSTLVVGAATGSGSRGAAYVFQRSASGWSQVARLAPADLGEGDSFGAAVALTGDLVLVSAPGQSARAGAVYVFRRTGTGWTQAAKLTASAAAERALFGMSIAASEDIVFVGSPGLNENRGGIVAFRREAQGGWVESATLTGQQLQPNDRLGTTLAFHDGVLMAGAPFAAGQTGAVFTFRPDDEGAWSQAARIVGFDAAGGYRFGAGLAYDNGLLWAGAPAANGGRGVVYTIWRAPDGGWGGASRLLPAVELERGAQFGSAVAAEADVAAVAMTGDDFGAGSVIIFEKDGDSWEQSAVLRSPPEALASVTGGEVRCGADGKAAGFDCGDVELLSFLAIPDLGGGRGVRLNDIWGWTDPQSGREYALIGRMDGTSFVDVSDPLRPVYVGNLPLTEGAQPSSWRDIKVYRNHAYVVADGAGAHGMQVLDLTRLRQFDGTPLRLTPDHTYRRINSAHNIVINEETGYAYAVGASSGGETCGGGLHMISIENPKEPAFAGCFADPQTGRASTGYSHDAQCVVYRGPDSRYTGREICLGANETALSIADVTDKANPRALSRASYPNVAYSHQGWLTEDQRYFYMNDELDEIGGVVDRTRTLVWDLADLEDPQLIRQHEGVEGATDHNLYIRDNLMYQSNYKSGLRILDISDPEQPREVAFFDTLPYGDNEAGFAGTWSNYPYFDSGIIIVSGIGEGLFVLKKRDSATVF